MSWNVDSTVVYIRKQPLQYCYITGVQAGNIYISVSSCYSKDINWNAIVFHPQIQAVEHVVTDISGGCDLNQGKSTKPCALFVNTYRFK